MIIVVEKYTMSCIIGSCYCYSKNFLCSRLYSFFEMDKIYQYLPQYKKSLNVILYEIIC